MQVRHILRDKGREVIAIPATASLVEAASLLTARRVGALVVRDGHGAAAGILSERDLVHALAAGGCEAMTDQVQAHMTPDPITCAESDSIDSVMETMTQGRFRHMPVQDEAGRLCGMISIGDVVKSRIAETTNEAAALRDYICATI